MDWRLFAATFATVFLAELGDKTQLATMSLAASGTSRWVVFAGAALALVTASAIAVLAGEALTRIIPAVWIHRAAGVLFVLLGVLMLVGGNDDEDAPSDPEPSSSAER
jgi:putative Ca2+/H+ antiporter (TMEM165/GDT1 family)